MPIQPRVLREIKRVLRRGASTPCTKHGKEKTEGVMLEIIQMLGAIYKHLMELNGVLLASLSLIRAKTDCSPILLSQLQTPQPVNI